MVGRSLGPSREAELHVKRLISVDLVSMGACDLSDCLYTLTTHFPMLPFEISGFMLCSILRFKVS